MKKLLITSALLALSLNSFSVVAEDRIGHPGDCSRLLVPGLDDKGNPIQTDYAKACGISVGGYDFGSTTQIHNGGKTVEVFIAIGDDNEKSMGFVRFEGGTARIQSDYTKFQAITSVAMGTMDKKTHVETVLRTMQAVEKHGYSGNGCQEDISGMHCNVNTAGGIFDLLVRFDAESQPVFMTGF